MAKKSSGLFTNYFKPSMYVAHFSEVNLTSLAKHGIKVFITDLDNTLVPHFKKLPPKSVFDFIESVKEHGMSPVIVSNNSKKRVAAFADKLKVPYVASAKKPFFKRVIKKIMEEHDARPNECIMMGDQLVTDILVANRSHIESILVQPMVTSDIKITKFNRFLERFIYKRLDRKNILRKGMYDSGELGEENELL